MTTRAVSVRTAVVSVILAAAVFGALASAASNTAKGYPNAGFLATGRWLVEHVDDPGLVVVDVREDKYFDGRVIPGAVRMRYEQFQEDDTARGVGSVFVGTARAQQVLGAHGITRESTVVLYDSVERDGGATSSYVFWVLDLLGHERKRVLERGIDGWVDAGGRVVDAPSDPVQVLYQAPREEIDLARLATGEFIRSRLGDPHYLFLDVRSPAEYLGEKPNKALLGGGLKPGHVPTAVNVEYKRNWTDGESKAIRSYGELLDLYSGLEGSATVVLYCHSGRRGSFSYFVLRLMGFDRVMLYDASWHEWGNPELFYPVELEARRLTGVLVPEDLRRAATSPTKTGTKGNVGAAGGYVSCGG